MKKELLLGLIIGLLSNLVGMYLYIYFLIDLKFETAIEVAIENDSIGSIIGLGAILNFLPFFVFIKKRQYYRARGVLFATVLAAIVILVSKFF